MPKVAFLIPASPIRAFFAQIAAFSRALHEIDWHRWEPSMIVCMGGEPDADGLREWMPHLRDVATIFIPAAESDATPWYYAQIDGLYRWAPVDADVLVRMDADTLPVGTLEDVLDYVAGTATIAGVIGHFKFPAWPGTSSRDAWLRIARGLITRPLVFAHSYTLTDSNVPEADRVTPFYLNDGAIFFSRTIFREFSERYLAIRPKLMERLPDPYYSGQVALTLAMTDIGAHGCALPMRYNFPNDDSAAARYHEELEQVRIFHYLRNRAFNRQQIFLNADNYRAFLDMPLTGVDRVFQGHATRLFGKHYPFAVPPINLKYLARARTDSKVDPLSPHTYQGALAAHRCQVSPALARLDSAIRNLEGELVSAATLDYAEQFEASGNRSLEPLMRFKQGLVSALGVEEAFSVYNNRLTLPDSGDIRLKAIQSQYAFASKYGDTFVRTASGGERFVIEAPALNGAGLRRPLEHVARSLYVACLSDARVRGRSAVIEAGGVALLDYQCSERDLFSCETDLDPAIFHATPETAWIVVPDNDVCAIEIDEAFMLLGPHTGAFGDWMVEYLPRYIAADLSGAMPLVPVLVDALLPETIRESLDLMLRPGIKVIEVPGYLTVRVRRLWCAPSIHYAPVREKMDTRFKWDYTCPSPRLILPVVREMARRAKQSNAGTPGADRIFLGRRPHGWRRLVNHSEIEGVATGRGFHVVYPEDLNFAEQVNLLRQADFVVAPEGSALFLAYFARPGTRICILNHQLIEGVISYNGIFDNLEITILTGPAVRMHADFPHRADYEIDANSFRQFLDEWLFETSGVSRYPLQKVSDAISTDLEVRHRLGQEGLPRLWLDVRQLRDASPAASEADSSPSAHQHEAILGSFNIVDVEPERLDLLERLLTIARGAFGVFDEYSLCRITYPWVAGRLEGLPSGSHVLDIGAGVSPVPFFLAERGAWVECVDKLEDRRTLPAGEDWNAGGFFNYSRLSARITANNCPIEEFEPSKDFDAVYSILCMEHLPRAAREETFRRCRQWLRRDGIMLHAMEIIPSSDFLWNRSQGQEIEPPVRHGTIHDVVDQLVILGFRVSERRVIRSISGSRTDLLLIACNAN